MNNFMAVMDKNETAKGARKSKPKLEHMRIMHAENGGHIVEHHMRADNVYHEPEKHVFGKEDGHEMLQHIAKHMKIEVTEPKEEAEPESEQAKEGAGAAY